MATDLVDILTAEAGFKRVAPRGTAEWPGFAAQFDSAAMRLIRADVRVLAEFLGQVSHESFGFTARVENLNYSAASLRRVFGRYYDGPEQPSADDHAGCPADIANWVYDDRNPARANKLGNVNDGDGWAFRGSGLIQITGRTNAARLAGRLNIPPNELMISLRLNSEFSWEQAALFFAGSVMPHWDGTTEQATRRINGGLHGFAARQVLVDGAHAAMSPALPLAALAAPSVMAVQQRLSDLDYIVGKIDGIAGRQTRAAIEAFQHDHGLVVDAIAGPATLSALDRAIARPTRASDLKSEKLLSPHDQSKENRNA